MDKPFKSCAWWPKGTLDFDDNYSEDYHHTLSAAQAVCEALQRKGFGWNGRIFPVKTLACKIEEEQSFDTNLIQEKEVVKYTDIATEKISVPDAVFAKASFPEDNTTVTVGYTRQHPQSDECYIVKMERDANETQHTELEFSVTARSMRVMFLLAEKVGPPLKIKTKGL